MPLADSRLHYWDTRDKIITILRNNIAILNAGLDPTPGLFTGNDDQIKAGNPRLPSIPLGAFPTILVGTDSKSEEFLSLGNAERKRPEITFKILAFVAHGAHFEDIEKQVLILADNIESIFRDNIDLDGTVLMSSPGAVEFGEKEEDGAFQYGVLIDLTVTKEVK